MENLRYPIGKFEPEEEITQKHVESWIAEIGNLPNKLRHAVQNLNDRQLDTPYRPGSWTIRQVVHHIADSHTHSYIRFKWALTEDYAVIKTYYEDRWAQLPDFELVPVKVNLDFIDNLHRRWVILLNCLNEEDLRKVFLHPESGEVRLSWNIGNYAWHGNHHLAQIENCLKREGWLP